MKHFESKLATGVDGLKAQSMPQPPPGLIDEMIAGDKPESRGHRGRLSLRIWMAAGVGGLGLTFLMLMPRNSSAAVSLDRLVQAQARSEVMYHLTSYWIEGKNRVPKIWSGYVKGEKWHYIQSNYEEASDGNRIMSYLPAEHAARVWTPTHNDPSAQTVLSGADLRWWQSSERKGLTVEHNVKWNGQRVDRYSITTTSKAWGPLVNTLYADPVLARPLYAEFIHASGNGSALKWDYLPQGDERLLRINLKPGTTIKDVTAERRRYAIQPSAQTEKAARGH